MGRRLLAVITACAIAAVASGCKPAPIRGYYCEGGVRDSKKNGVAQQETMGGECLFVEPLAAPGDPASIGTATWVTDFTIRYTVKRTSRTTYTLERDGKQVATMTADGAWIRLQFSVVPGSSRTVTGKTYGLRNDMPGFLN